MKKSLAVLSILACMFGLCACGSGSTAVVDPFLTEQEAIEQGQIDAAAIISIVTQGTRDQYVGYGDVVLAGIDSWESALEDVGSVTGVISTTAEVSEDEAIVDVTLGGTSHDAVMELIYTEEGYGSISTTVVYSFGEMMGKAGLNTLIGMGTVFVVLILISLIISCFNFIPKIQNAFAKKNNDSSANIKAEAVDNTIAQIIEKEELSDDLELVAVIAAAIAASEGAVGTDGFVVRSIRKRA